MNNLSDKIKSLAKENFSQVQAIRHHLHAHPELSFKEFNTSKFITEQLKKIGVEYRTGIVNTGIEVLLKGKNPGSKTIMLRADMDALPIQEENKVDYCSKNEGVMHACGHDVHSSCVLGAVFILNELKDEFEGTIKVIFQPAEEVLPGGASLMIKENILENPKVEVAIAQHVFPSMETGRVGFRPGMYMASSDELYVSVIGKGGHAAVPNEYNNPLIIASELLLELNAQFMEQDQKGENGEVIPTVIAFGKISGNGATNIIPEKVNIEGTFRTMNEEWRKACHKKIREIANDIAKIYKAEIDVRIEVGYPFLVNDSTVTKRAKAAAESYLGKENVIDLPIRMAAEDFAYFSQQVPACFYRLGTGNKSKGIVSGVHTSTFDIDEQALEIGSGLMAWIAVNELRK